MTKDPVVGQFWQDIEVDSAAKRSLPFRVYQPEEQSKTPPLVLYFAGGAFQATDHKAERPIARAFADSGAVVVEADYSTPSLNAFPEVLEYAFGALNCMNSKRSRWGARRSLLIVAGEEAGGNVAAAVALKARDQLPGQLDGQILLSPLIDPLMATVSIREAEGTGMQERWVAGWNHYLRTASGLCHPYAAPGLCSRLSGLAPAMIVTAENDPLRDEVAGYAAKLSAAGVEVDKHVLPASCGWTGIYDGEQAGSSQCTHALRSRFEAFIEKLNTR